MRQMMHQVRNIIILAQVLIGLSLTSEAQLKDTTHFFQLYEYNNDIKFISYVDDQKTTIRSVFKDKNAAITENNLAIFNDTTKIRPFPHDFVIKHVVIFDKPIVLIVKNPAREGYEPNYRILNLINGELTPLDLNGHILTYFDGNFIWGELNMAKYDGSGDFITHLQQFSIDGKTSSSLINIESTPDKAEGIVGVYPFEKDNLLIIKRAPCHIPLTGCGNSKSYMLNIAGNKVKELQNDPLVEEVLSGYVVLSRNYHLVKLNGNFLLYSSSGRVDSVLYRQFQVIGWNYQDGKLHSYNLKSTLDEKKHKTGKTLKEVIIPYKLTYALEISLYNIYQNQEIDKALFKEFGLYELLILKNMVFAKHNYAFDKPFYQAFFNLFDFYNSDELRKSRTKEVGQLLSEVDKKNLKLIMNALKKFKD